MHLEVLVRALSFNRQINDVWIASCCCCLPAAYHPPAHRHPYLFISLLQHQVVRNTRELVDIGANVENTLNFFCTLALRVTAFFLSGNGVYTMAGQSLLPGVFLSKQNAQKLQEGITRKASKVESTLRNNTKFNNKLKQLSCTLL